MEQLPAPQENQAVVPQDIAAILQSVTPQQQKFAEFYALYDNAAKAARLAGYADNGSTPYVMLRDPRIVALVQYHRAVYAEASLYTPAKVIQQWALQASFNVLDLLHEDWSLRRLDELSPEVRAHLGRALINVEVIQKENTRTIKPRFSKVESLEHLGRLLRLYDQDKHGAEGLTININVSAATQPQLTAEGVDVGPVQIRLDPGRPEAG